MPDSLTHRVVASDLSFPEGPVVLRDGSVLVVEIRGARLTRIRPDGDRETVASWAGPDRAGPNGAAIGPDGACYICNNGGFIWSPRGDFSVPADPKTGATQPDAYLTGSIDRVDLATGEIRALYTECDGQRLCGPNDLVFDREGGLWFTDHGKRRAFDEDRCGVYYAAADGSRIERTLFPLHAPNGIGLSPDESTLYVAETPTGRLWSYPVTHPGKVDPRGAQCLVNTIGRFDSLGVEADGTVVVAAIDQGLCVVRPNGETSYVDVPGPAATNICWGGDDMKTAYVTESLEGKLYAYEWPRPGLELAYSV
ncbi:MAG: SMP-30/gluconolactonase/LRE family protein [bacterium]|nr:gluconolaconase [Deltaproteobacteria bacterium]MCP4906179.1 SMP-30/gluconolactonase/LRE family protein [bacterium]